MNVRFSKALMAFVVAQVLLSSTLCLGQETTTDSLAFQQIISDFQASIEKKDSTRFYSLFFSDEISFVGIMSPTTEGSIKKDYPDFEGIAVSTHKRFIRDICKSPKQQKEEFHNVDISSDGNIASISFDYGFYADKKLLQWGHEKWNLVRINQQWFITDVIYSIHFPDLEPFPSDSSH